MTRARSVFAVCAVLVSCKSRAPLVVVDAAPAPIAVVASGIVSHDEDASLADDPANANDAADSGAHGKIQTLTDADAHKISDPIVPGVSFVLPVFLGDFGPSSRTFFAITQSDTMATFGVVALASRGDHWEKVSTAPLVDANWNGWQLDAVLFEDVDGNGTRTPIVIAEYMTGIGPTGAQPFVVVTVYRLKNGAFVHASEIEKVMDGAIDAKTVRARLAKPSDAQASRKRKHG